MSSSTVRHKEFGADHGLIHEAVITGRKVGAGEEFWKALAHDQEAFRRALKAVLREQNEQGERVSLSQAIRIMGHANVYRPTHVCRVLGGDYDPELVKRVPFSAQTLQAAVGTHLLVAVAPLSLVEIHGKCSEVFYSNRNPWFAESEQQFAHVRPQAGWYLIRKEEVPGSIRMGWSEQQALLSDDEYVPSIAVLAQAAVLHYKRSGERLFGRFWVRTADVTAEGYRAGVRFDPDGLYVLSWNDNAIHYIGVASARKGS